MVLLSHLEKTEQKTIKRKFSISVKKVLWYTSLTNDAAHLRWDQSKILWLVLLISCDLGAQDRKVDPTWLHRYLPQLNNANVGLSSESCRYQPIFGEGDADRGILRSVSRFGEVTIDPSGSCQSTSYDREEELYFVIRGDATLRVGDQTFGMRANDFTYLPPGNSHSLANRSEQPVKVIVMGFKIPSKISRSEPAPVKIVNMGDLKEETVDGHPTSVLYKLLAGPRRGKRDAIDDAYVVTSLFWMDFAPGGTKIPASPRDCGGDLSSHRRRG